MKRIFDLTKMLTENFPVFPGDPKIKIEKIKSIGENSLYALFYLKMGNHTGTHIDFPAHVIKNGKTSSDYDLENFIGSGLIIKVPENQKAITPDFLAIQHIKKNDIVFLETANKSYLTLEALDWLIQKKIKIIGVDALSVDVVEDTELLAHKKLLSHDILIVENLMLSNIPAGRCKIYIMPLKIADMDGLPVRVMAGFKW